MRIASRLMRIALGILILLVLAGGGGFLWLWTSPYWAGITLFSDGKRVENFRTMERVFPYRDVAASGSVWAFTSDPRPLPQTYRYNGELRDTATFLDETQTTGLIVVHDGVISHEEYRLGATGTSRFTSWSMAKSVLSALVGIALKEGHIGSLADRIDQYVPELVGSGYDGVTIEDALTMSSGVSFDEDYGNPFSDVNMLFFKLAAGADMRDTLVTLVNDRPTGTYNNYVSSDSIAIGLMLEAATGMPLDRYLEARLWTPMGAESDAFWSTGRAGAVLPFCCLNARLRDYARFGRLYLMSGRRGSHQIVPSDWVTYSTRPIGPHLEPGENPASSWTFGYGYHWWIPEAPEDEFLAIGIWGQYIYVDRFRRIVIIKSSADPDFDTRDHETVAVFRAISKSIADGR
ncbi:serine hydrolase [uncultured Roseobacter sp.]|uniref:serine hydrolase domain-containing protein n=1 Tax=uncultured Roseobacter sp. TaxID=114847 RepID=UPI002601C4A5|nr:serine hydrolase [uncultured Roseobacter sp.]